jgi:DUF4097 and DUF4098 domain-containing protein YvlB
MRRTPLAAALVAALLLGGSAHAARAVPVQDNRARLRGGLVEVRSIDTTFRMDKGGVVDLETAFGAIIVTGSTGNDIRVRATAGNGRVRLRASSTLVTLRATPEHGGVGDVRFEVTVPAGVRVLMHTASGAVTATGVRGDVEIESISGDVRIEDITGLATIEAVSGEIVAARLTGGARIEATSGDVRLTGAAGDISVENTSGTTTLTGIRSGLVRAESVSGDVRFEGTVESEGRYEFASHSGSIRLTLPPTAGAVLTLSTYNGSINSDFPITLQQTASGSRDKQLQFRLGSGSARLTAESFSGNIFITRGGSRDRQE